MNLPLGPFTPPEDADLFAAHLAIMRARYEQAMAEAGIDVLILDAGMPPPWYRDDVAGDWRVNPHFRLFTPLSPADGCAIVLRPGTRPALLQLAPSDYWHQPPAFPKGCWTGAFNIETVADAAAREARIADLSGPHSARIGPGADTAPASLLAAVDHARAHKTPWELECLRRANRRAVCGHRVAGMAFQDGASEFEIHLAYLRATAHEDAELPYRSIVALDRHGAVLHYQYRERTIGAPGGGSLLIDAGADLAGYAADITRTHARAPGVFANLVSAVDALQRTLLAHIRPGLAWLELHQLSHRLLAELLIEAGLARGSPEALVATGVTRCFLPHGLGHLLGTQTHDAGGLLGQPDGTMLPPPAEDPALRLTRTLGENFVVTVEPGLYFIPVLLEPLRQQPAGRALCWDVIDLMAPFGGIRIEDDVRVTATGIENLTRDAFAALDTIRDPAF